jgi:hypothetical protein
MRIIKLGVISFIVFFILLFLMSLLIPSHIRVSRAINIETPKATIAPYLSDIKNWPKWNELNVDSIEVRILKADLDSVNMRWRYKDRTIHSSLVMHESAGITVVQWYFDFHLKWYPWEKFGSITFDKQFGKPMENSLNNLKKLIENSP